MSDINRTSRGLIEEIQEIIYNLMAIGDHLLDLNEDDLIEALEHIEIVNGLRQELIASYAKSEQVDHRYHCAYKHGLKVIGMTKEAIIAAQRNNNEDIRNTLLKTMEVFMNSFNWLITKYLKINVASGDNLECRRCLDDILLNKEANNDLSDEPIRYTSMQKEPPKPTQSTASYPRGSI